MDLESIGSGVRPVLIRAILGPNIEVGFSCEIHSQAFHKQIRALCWPNTRYCGL